MLIQDALTLAMEHEKAGRLEEAHRICRAIVDQNPSVAAAWNFLGMVCARRGEDEIAIQHIKRAIELEPNCAPLFANLGELERQTGRLEDATSDFRKAVSLEQGSALLRNKLGIALRQMGKFEESEREFAVGIGLDPRQADLHNNRGNALRDLGRLDEAIEEYRQAIGIKPDLPDAHRNLANVLSDLGRFDEAMGEYRAALGYQPKHAETLSAMAGLLRKMERYDEALSVCREAIGLKPGFAEGYNVLGTIFYDREEFEEAIGAFEKAIELEPNSAMKRNNIALAYGAMGRYGEATGSAEAAVRLKPDYAEGFNTLGNLLADQARYDDAAAAFERAIGLNPGFAVAHWNLSLILLLRGDFERGWAEHEWRKKTTVRSRPREFEQPAWDGGDLDGRKILLHHEQGYGDMIQFVRYAPLVAERGGRVILSCPEELVSLLREIPEIEEVTVADRLPDFDVQCAMQSLPAVFKTRLDSIPAKVPYLKAPVDCVARWRDALAGHGGKLRVGVTWAGNPKRRLDRQRSVTLEDLKPVAAVKGVCLFGLQKGWEKQPGAALPDSMELIDLSERLDDFAETAGAIENMDLVITVDTSVAHLAGAMGKPVWVLIGFVPAWRWMLDRSDSPWYPTMRLFRQPKFGDWKTPILQVAKELQRKIDG